MRPWDGGMGSGFKALATRAETETNACVKNLREDVAFDQEPQGSGRLRCGQAFKVMVGETEEVGGVDRGWFWCLGGGYWSPDTMRS